jgi:nucleotide-binding universal stress UspA family protein
VKVLVGFDGSPDATAAIAIGAALFPGAHAHIAHVWMPPFTVHPSPAQRREARTVEGLIGLLEQEGRSRADQVTAEGVLLAREAGWDVEPVTRRGFAGPGLELARLAEQIDADVLIVGARGLNGVRALLGSVSDAAAHYSPVPVLVVPRRGSHDPVDGPGSGPLLTAYDGSDGAKLALATARRLWPSRKHVVASVASSTVQDLAPDDELVRAVLAPKGVPETARSIADALAAHAASVGAAAIVVGSRGRSAHREVLLGSVAMATLHHAHRPVLAVPPPMRLALAAEPAALAG